MRRTCLRRNEVSSHAAAHLFELVTRSWRRTMSAAETRTVVDTREESTCEIPHANSI